MTYLDGQSQTFVELSTSCLFRAVENDMVFERITREESLKKKVEDLNMCERFHF